jgi:hypothetical protein
MCNGHLAFQYRSKHTIIEALVTLPILNASTDEFAVRHSAAPSQEVLSSAPYDRRQAQPGQEPLICLT